MSARHLLLVGAGAVLLLGACSSDTDSPTPGASPSSSASSPAATGGNGQVFTSEYGAGDVTIRRYPIAADGSVGEAVQVLTGPGGDTTFAAVVDALGQTLVTGTFDDYWTTELQIRDLQGAQTGTLATASWCGGEALTFNLCALVSDTALARTTDLGGEDPADGSVIVTALPDGSTVAEHGPFPGLSAMLGTTQPNTLLLATSTEKGTIDDPSVPGTIVRLDTTTGTTTDVADYPEAWSPLCAIGTDTVLGATLGTTNQLSVVGSADIGEVELGAEDTPLGCSADGAFLYVQNIPQPPTGENDSEAPNPASALERISLADGSRQTVAALVPGEFAGPITR